VHGRGRKDAKFFVDLQLPHINLWGAKSSPSNPIRGKRGKPGKYNRIS
jgi:hypothetical protein